MDFNDFCPRHDGLNSQGECNCGRCTYASSGLKIRGYEITALGQTFVDKHPVEGDANIVCYPLIRDEDAKRILYEQVLAKYASTADFVEHLRRMADLVGVVVVDKLAFKALTDKAATVQQQE